MWRGNFMLKKIKKAIAIILIAVFAATVPNSLYAGAIGRDIYITVSDSAENDRISAMAQPKDRGLCLAKDGKTDYVLVYSASVGERLEYAVEFFARTFETMTGARLEIRTDDKPETAKEIVIGETSRGSFAPENAGADGYRILTKNEKLFLCVVNELGSMNAVYGFLEDELGCLWATDREDYIPYQPMVYIKAYDTVEKPAMDWRNVYSYETAQPNRFEKLRLNGIGYYPNSDKVNQYNQWGTWCHSFQFFVSEKEYFDEHPEYFAMLNGKRAKSADGCSAQLCLSNPDVLKIVREKLNRMIEESPEQIFWDFSIMDNRNRCTCHECQKADNAAGGSGMGSLLPFLNELAKEHPDKYISTLAYFYTEDPPKNIRAESNIVIKLCAMPGDQACSYADLTSTGARDFGMRLKKWKNFTDNIIVWDYVVNFSHLLLPFPNFGVQQSNQKFYEDNNVMGIFHQASREVGGEFTNLRAYVLAKLMWKGSGLNVSSVIARYLEIYYGSAARYIAEYMNRCASSLKYSVRDLGLYDEPFKHQSGYLSGCNIAYYQKCFAKAEKAVEGNAVFTDRVKEAKIPVLYAKINEDSFDEKGRAKAADEFFELCDRFGITQRGEINASIEDYKNGGMQAAVKEIHKKRIMLQVSVVGSLGEKAIKIVSAFFRILSELFRMIK